MPGEVSRAPAALWRREGREPFRQGILSGRYCYIGHVRLAEAVPGAGDILVVKEALALRIQEDRLKQSQIARFRALVYLKL